MASALPAGVDVMAMCEALAESGGEFAKQFDRSSPEYHGGLETAVPTGGGRVPESMGGAEAANWRELPETQATIEPDYGPEYDAAMANYEGINRIKKAISTLNKPVEKAMKVRLQYKGAESEGDKTALESRLKGEESLRDGALAAAAEAAELVDKSCLSERARSALEEVIERGKFHFEDKDTFGEYMTTLQRCNQAIFADQKKLLQQIKDIKKAAKVAVAEPVAQVATPARIAGLKSAAENELGAPKEAAPAATEA